MNKSDKTIVQSTAKAWAKPVAQSVACALLVIGSTPSALSAPTKDACGKAVNTARLAQLAVDIQQIINVASLHEYYHGAWMHKEELENAWARKADDITWTNNTDKYIGQKSVWKFYVEDAKQMPTKGMMAYHMLTTPVIEVAGDGKTAKGIFMSFGNVTGATNGVASAQWTQEKYGIDFIKEDGQWKIWHLRTYVEFYSDVKKSWTDPGANVAAATVQGAATKDSGTELKAAVQQEAAFSFEMSRPDQQDNFYYGYTPTREPVLNPAIPRPYCTWKDTTAF